MMNQMMQETLTTGTARKADARRLPGRRQDRHEPGFPRRLVRRLHRPSGRRRVARQRRQFADQEADRRRHAGRHLEPLHEGRASGPADGGPARHGGAHVRSGAAGAAALASRRPRIRSPRCCRRRRAAPLGREDDMRPRCCPLAPARPPRRGRAAPAASPRAAAPPASAAGDGGAAARAAHRRVAHRAAAPPRAAPRMRRAAQPQYAAPQPQMAPPLQLSNVPRRPAPSARSSRSARAADRRERQRGRQLLQQSVRAALTRSRSVLRARAFARPHAARDRPERSVSNAGERERDRDRPRARAEQMPDDHAARSPRRPSARRRPATTPCRRVRKRHHGARDGLRLHQPHADRVDRHRARPAESADAPPSGTAATRRKPAERERQRADADGAVEPDADRRCASRARCRRDSRRSPPRRRARTAAPTGRRSPAARTTSRRSTRTRPRS